MAKPASFCVAVVHKGTAVEVSQLPQRKNQSEKKERKKLGKNSVQVLIDHLQSPLIRTVVPDGVFFCFFTGFFFTELCVTCNVKNNVDLE